MNPFEEDATEIRDAGEELLQLYQDGIPDGPEAVICVLWEYTPHTLVGIMRAWWFNTQVPQGFDVQPFYPDHFEDVESYHFAQRFCTAMARDEETAAYGLARTFIGEANFTDVCIAMEKIAETVLVVRGQA